MTPTAMTLFQVLPGVCWLPAIFLWLPSLFRVWFGNMVERPPDVLDRIIAPFVFVAAYHFGFTIRWVVWRSSVRLMEQSEMAFYATLNITAAIMGAAICLIWIQIRTRHPYGAL